MVHFIPFIAIVWGSVLVLTIVWCALAWDHYRFWKRFGFYGRRKGKR